MERELPRNFQGQVVIVTGASGGLGTHVVAGFLKAGATVIGISQSIDESNSDPGLHRIAANLEDPDAVREIIGKVLTEYGRADVLVHVMGGYVGGATIAEMDDAAWQHMMNLNLHAAFYVFRAVLPSMRAAGRGRIIAIGSRAAVEPGARVGAYSASKAALVSLVKTIAIENQDKQIRANVLLPGTMDTPGNRTAMPNADPAKWVRPQHVASLVLWLAGEAGEDINGAAIPVYGADL